MPSVEKGSKILVTGANGYVGHWVVKQLLDDELGDFKVRCAVRTVAKGNGLEEVFAVDKEKGRLEVVVVEDITKPSAFDIAVQDIDAVIHAASPVTTAIDDPNEVIEPAVKGTLSLLSSIKSYGQSVKRVISISSVLSAADPFTFPTPDRPTLQVDSSSWNEVSSREVEEKGKEAHPYHKLSTAKLLAEKAAWSFVKENEESISFDLVTILPPSIFGPFLHNVPEVASLNASLAHFHGIFTSLAAVPAPVKLQPMTDSLKQILLFPVDFIDVRDTATAIVNSLRVTDAGGKRLLITGGKYTNQDIVDEIAGSALAFSADPEGVLSRAILHGTPGAGQDVVPFIAYDASVAKKLLGLKYRSLETCVMDTASQMRKLGWI